MQRRAHTALLTLVVLLLAVGGPGSVHAQTDVAAQTAGADEVDSWDILETTFAYVVQFYPLWFTYGQSKIVSPNHLAGPETISPIYHIVVAINDDTLYASSLSDVRAEPVVVTIPATPANYSILVLDAYGDIIKTGIMNNTPGTYVLTGPDWTGALPAGLTPTPVHVDFFAFIIRADRYSASGVNQEAEANQFRENVRMLPLSQYLANPGGGATTIFPEIYFSQPFKSAADNLVKFDPIRFLTMLQEAVASSNTPPLSPYEQALSDRFDELFGDGTFGPGEDATKFEFAEGTRSAHAAIVGRYLSHTGPTNWISFTNIGDWGENVIERSAISEFIQYGNGYDTAAYYHTFKDGSGKALNGSGAQGYVLKFPPGQLPEASRFWSLTAYTPEDVELVWNLAKKYVVASYTPGLELAADGSLSIHLSADPPLGKTLANWLPVPRGPFNIMLRVYGPEGSIADATYVPPPVGRPRHNLIPIRPR